MGSIYRIGAVDQSHPERAGLVRRALETLALWRNRVTQRRQLAQLAQDPHLLRDLGLSRQDASSEISKKFWRP
jgi:uncharacterized protein YjiS (DUF1127 family)